MKTKNAELTVEQVEIEMTSFGVMENRGKDGNDRGKDGNDGCGRVFGYEGSDLKNEEANA